MKPVIPTRSTYLERLAAIRSAAAKTPPKPAVNFNAELATARAERRMSLRLWLKKQEKHHG